jgi:hypothetical protein
MVCFSHMHMSISQTTRNIVYSWGCHACAKSKLVKLVLNCTVTLLFLLNWDEEVIINKGEINKVKLS